MMGSLEEAIQDACSKPTGSEDVINDLDIEDEEIAIENAHVILFIYFYLKDTCEHIQTLVTCNLVFISLAVWIMLSTYIFT